MIGGTIILFKRKYVVKLIYTPHTQKTLAKHIDWQESPLHAFWTDIAPCDHVVQVYETDSILLDSVVGFICSGFIAGDTVIVVVPAGRRAAIERRLKNRGFNLSSLSSENRYIILDAGETLARFMVDDRPDERLFLECAEPMIKNAQHEDRKVRTFGEMVSILWEQGLEDAAIELENLWNKLQETHNFTLFCSYPKSGFKNGEECVERVCSAHTKRIDSTISFTNEVLYKSTS